MSKLVLSLNGTVLQQRFIDKECIGIGRDASNDIVIDDPLLSGKHVRIVSVGEDQIAEDMRSSNGTLVNGRPLVRKILQHRDVIELGAHHLCYLNSRVAGDIDFDRTMLITALPRYRAPVEGAPIAAASAVRPAKAWPPEASVKILAGAGQHGIGENVRLDRVVTTFGIPGDRLIVITRRPQGYFLTHVEGARFPRVNRQSTASAPRPLRDGDLIEAAGYQLEFRLVAPAARQ